MKIDAYITCMHAFPAKKGASGDVFLLAFTDGSFGMCVRRMLPAATICNSCIQVQQAGPRGVALQGRPQGRCHLPPLVPRGTSPPSPPLPSLPLSSPSPQGNAIVTAGEDGCVRVWSRTGMLRSQLAALAAPVYALAWGSDGDRVAFSSGKDVVIKPLQVGWERGEERGALHTSYITRHTSRSISHTSRSLPASTCSGRRTSIQFFVWTGAWAISSQACLHTSQPTPLS